MQAGPGQSSQSDRHALPLASAACGGFWPRIRRGESPSLLPLFRSCRFMRDLVLSLHHVRLEVSLPVPPEQLAATQSKLLLACKLPASRLTLRMRQDGDPEDHADNPAHASARMLMLDTMAAAGHELTVITHVRLTVRAFLKAPRVLLFDEATSALDTTTEHHILDALRLLAQGRTSVFVAHRLSTAAQCDQIVVLNKGKVVESGSHSELLSRQGLYAQLWSRQAVVDDLLAPDEGTEEGTGALLPEGGVARGPAAA